MTTARLRALASDDLGSDASAQARLAHPRRPRGAAELEHARVPTEGEAERTAARFVPWTAGRQPSCARARAAPEHPPSSVVLQSRRLASPSRVARVRVVRVRVARVRVVRVRVARVRVARVGLGCSCAQRASRDRPMDRPQLPDFCAPHRLASTRRGRLRGVVHTRKLATHARERRLPARCIAGCRRPLPRPAAAGPVDLASDVDPRTCAVDRAPG